MTHVPPGTLRSLMEKNGKDFVQACYQEILHRDADAEGQAHHLQALENGLSKARIVASIASSDEACLNNMATSQIAKAARLKAFEEGGSLLRPLKHVLGQAMERKKTIALEGRRQTLLEQIQASAAQSPAGTQQAVETLRLALEDWQRKMGKGRAERHGINNKHINNLWFDLTTAFQWHGGVVGIVRAELEMACGLARLYPDLRFSMQIDQGFAEIDKSELHWLLNAENVADAYMRFFARYKGATDKPKSIHIEAPDIEGFFHPYEDGDAVIAVGWMDSQKERYFSLVKREVPSLHLFYLVYDIILLLDDTKHFYDPVGRERFERYVEWISYNCDMIFYGGRTAQADTEALQKEKGWPTPPGVPVKFGTDIVKSKGTDDDEVLLKTLGITGEYIITVGSLEPRKNHETLYRAYLMALEMENDDLPQLIFIGKPMWRVDDMLDTILRHPRLKEKLLCLTPTDLELAVLYKHCRFTLLPSLYEGWSLTLPESLGQGKFCLCSDTPPLREIGGNLVDYVDVFDIRGWAEKIITYSKDDKLLHDFENRIAKDWPNTKWSDTAQMLLDAVEAYSPSGKNQNFDNPPVIWMDLTTSFLEWEGSISGIVRAELEYARYLKKIDPRTSFFAYQRGYNYFFKIEDSYLEWLFDSEDLSASYSEFRNFWNEHEKNGTGHRNPFRQQGCDGNAYPAHAAYLPHIPRNSVVFFAGIDSDGTGNLSRIEKIKGIVDDGNFVTLSQTIYDLTPILTPHLHMPPTCLGFGAMFEYVSNHFDHIIYGGRTAQCDGISVQKQQNWKVPVSDFVEFGSDINASGEMKAEGKSDSEILKNLGLNADFAITVGTIEPRKNHEALYKAYLMMLRQGLLDKAFQLVFVGNRGWKSGDFLASLEQDERVKGKILIMSPSDEELDVLYRNCKFTLLPSFYEGWSLTLPESLSYGKFCLTSDVDPLRETGRDLVEYIHPLDAARWAERMAYYANNSDALEPWEKKIESHWKARTWYQSAEMLLEALRRAHGNMIESYKASLKEGGV
ncbi:MAG: glycosyltransferase [Sphingobium sp.]|nr:glycosyltransferase [Sphingobium sp.]